MPMLTKKTVLKPKLTLGTQLSKNSNFKKFKTPLLTKENIEGLLRDKNNQSQNENFASSSQYNQKKAKTSPAKPTIMAKTKSNLSITSMHLSFENISHKDSETVSDLSFRMNEPKVKEAYFQFVTRLSQSSNKNVNITSSPLTEKPIEDNVSLLEKSLQDLGELDLKKKNADKESMKAKPANKKTKVLKKQPSTISRNSKNKKTKDELQLNKKSLQNETQILLQNSPLETQMLSADSGVSLSQEVLNQNKKVKSEYFKFIKSSLEPDNGNNGPGIKKSKQIKQRKRAYIISSSEESFDEPILKAKSRKPIRILSEEDVLMSPPLQRRDGAFKIKDKKGKPISKNSNKIKSLKSRDVNLSTKGLKKKNLMKFSTDVEDTSDKNLTLEEKMAKIQESRNVGLYAFCDICDKARYLPHVKDPLDLPAKWYCAMNPDERHNKCSDPEEVEEDEDFLIHNLYNAGSIVWARMDGYPWWPAMVEDDPDTEEYFWLEGNSMKPTWYHVTFFDSERVTRAWIRLSLRPFKINMDNPLYQIPEKNKLKSRVDAAFKQACDAIELPLIERLKKYSFMNRYKKPSKKRQIKKDTEKKNQRKKILSQDVLLGHKMDSSEERNTSFPVGTEGYPNNELSRQSGELSSIFKNKENFGDSPIGFNDPNWIESQNLSFSLFD